MPNPGKRRNQAVPKPFREKKPGARPLVGNHYGLVKKKVETTVQKDFLRQVSDFLEKARHNPSKPGLMLPEIREHSFAKIAGRQLTDISLQKDAHWVYRRRLLPFEKSGLHTHFASTHPSFSDLYSFLRSTAKRRDRVHAIAVFEAGPKFFELAKTLENVLFFARYNQAEGKKPLTLNKVQSLRAKARAAVKDVHVSGTVIISPTKAFSTLTKAKLLNLFKFVENIAQEEMALTNEMRAHPQNLEITKRKWLDLNNSANKFILENFPALFRLRFVPMEGYRHDPKTMRFVKA